MNIFDELQRHLKSYPGKFGSRQALVLLDIDDTLIDCRYRKHQVFLDFAALPEIRKEFHHECQILESMQWQDIQYRVHDNLKSLGIDKRSFGDRLFRFWLDHYFTYPYLIQDIAFPGAVAFVQRCYASGLGIVYLTGRDLMGMGPGTYASLKQLDFPTEGSGIHFFLKPDPKLADLSFKLGALEEIATLGPVLAAFENELANLNAMAQRFPEAAMYWRKTIYAPEPPAPHPRVQELLAFVSL